MPVIDPYPTPQFGGPTWTRFYVAPVEFLVEEGTAYKNGGVDRWLRSESGIYRFFFDYEGISQLEAKIVIDHNVSAFDTAYGFDFTQPKTGDLYLAVHYDKFEIVPHDKVWIQKLKVSLIKRP